MEAKPEKISETGDAGNSSLAESVDDYLRLRVVGQDASELHFKVKRSTNFAKLKRSYSDRIGVPISALRFIFDGQRVNDTDSPSSLAMEEDDVIEVYQEQVGGNCETDFKAFNSGELNLDEEDELYDDEPTNQSLTPTDSIQNLHHEHHLNHHSAHHCHQHYTSAAHGKPHRPLSPLKQTAYQKTVQTFLNGSSILKQLNTLRLEEANLLKEIESLENATIEEDDEELIEFQRIERDIKLAEINKCLALIRNQISKQLAESEQSRNGSPTNTNSRAPLAESEGDTDSQVSSRHNESPSQIASPQPQVQRFIHLSETDDSSGSEDEETEERDDHQRLNMSPSMVHETLLQESIERSLASVGEMRHAFQSMVVNANIVGSVPLTVTNKQLRRGSEYENQDYHQCHSTHLKSLSFVEAPNTEVECFKSEHSTFEEQPQFDENNDDNEDDVESYEMINSQRPESAASGRRFPIDEDSNRVCTPSNVVLRSQNVPATSATSLASNAHRPLTLYLPSANSQLNLITHLHALGHDLTNSTVTNSLLITPFTCSGYLYKQCARPKVGRKKWRKRYFHFNRIRRIFVYFDDRASFEKHQHPKRGVFFDEIQDVYVDHAKSKNHSTSNKTPTSPDENGPTGGNGGRCVFVVSTTELNRKFTLSTFVPELMRIWMDVIFTGANGYLQDYDDYEN